MLPTCEIVNKTAFYKTGMNYECEVGSMISRGGDEKVTRHFYTNQRNLAGYKKEKIFLLGIEPGTPAR